MRGRSCWKDGAADISITVPEAASLFPGRVSCFVTSLIVAQSSK